MRGTIPETIQRIIVTLKTGTGCNAVGIRLPDGDDYPYYAQNGFSPDFLLTENTLIVCNTNSGECRDRDGRIKLECTCGLVICGKTDPANPLFTEGGSFWTNDSFSLLDIPTAEDPRLHPRNLCIHQGYASVALIPIRSNNRIIGLIHLNDRHHGVFTKDTVRLLEGIAVHIGIMLTHRQVEEEKAKLEAQFQQAQRLESVGRLAGGVAHDFNNMLGVILGHAELVLDRIDASQPLYDDLMEIRNAAERSANLTRQLLAFARKQTAAPRILDLNLAITSMLNMLQKLIGENISLNWHSDESLWSVKIDPAQIDQVLANLCVNARDAIPNVGIITIETKNCTLTNDYCIANKEAVPGEYVRLTVSDDGCGMDKGMLTNIFEPFFTTKGIGKGTGLGLATIHGIVKQNNGFINVYSESGHGSTFSIYLPRYLDGTEKVAGAEGVVQMPEQGHETILLVEDEPGILKVTTRMLEMQGYTVVAASTPGEAIRLAEEYGGEISLIMTDVVMPEMNGRDLAKYLRSLYPHIKQLFMSGYTADVISQQGVIAEGVHFIQKPFGPKSLITKIREVLAQV